MKSPAEYVQATVGPGPVHLLTRADAERAIATALADAERYKTNLVGAVLRAHSSTSQAPEATPADDL